MKQMNKPKDKDVHENSVEVVAESITPHSKAMYEAGKTLLVDSISTGREFCHSMIGYSTGAIPIYLGILTFILPKDYLLGIKAGVTVAFPAIVFLLSSITFTIGYLPIKTNFSLDVVEEIEKERNKIIMRRNKLIKIGFSIFSLGTLAAIWVVVLNLGVR